MYNLNLISFRAKYTLEGYSDATVGSPSFAKQIPCLSSQCQISSDIDLAYWIYTDPSRQYCSVHGHKTHHALPPCLPKTDDIQYTSDHGGRLEYPTIGIKILSLTTAVSSALSTNPDYVSFAAGVECWPKADR
ncbi:hypothetical protein BaRGS_00022575 [Batillaria attramentaria]|uniref:Uncharacterized protein n=1 Tax=Batillaria attramentaria TaxID=370345 RepID=A0ABD0KGN5_9CAEN